ncbi:MAG: sigma-70 family RNA polymerase sigma factor [Chthoniobacter sp.]|nr:sigma-70 family RNA polymerase sigma factor [Chthoniobacter sp.]
MTEAAFHPTRWTLVLRASGEGAEAKAALSDLCAAYYAPVVAFIRRDGRGDDAAREKAHTFFATVLADGIGTPERKRGRFRGYLLGALKHFLSKQRDAALAEKRGGGAERVPIDAGTDTSPGLPLPAAPDDALIFDRAWAFTVIARALDALEAEHAEKATHFTTLKPWLDGAGDIPQADAARVLGLSETAVKVAIHRLRARFREFLRAEVAATVNDPADAADELRHLIEIVSAA